MSEQIEPVSQHAPRSTEAALALCALLGNTVDQWSGAEDELTSVEGYLWLMEYATGMAEYYLHADPAHPVLMPMVTPFRRFMGDHPYGQYLYVARLGPDYSYRLHCLPGDAEFHSVTVHADEVEGFAGNRSLGKFHDREVERNADGSFDIVISRERQPGNWIGIDETVGSLLTREFFYAGPQARREAQWSIEVLDESVPLTRPSDASLAVQLNALVNNFRAALRRYPLPIGQPVFGTGALNEFADFFEFSPTAVTTWGNLDAIHTTMPYELSPDEALVIHGGAPVECAWWGITQNNRFLASFGVGEPVCLPGGSVQLEPDGSWVAVLAEEDPGTANWLSTAGHRHGLVRIRWLLAHAHPSKPSTLLVKASEVREHLELRP